MLSNMPIKYVGVMYGSFVWVVGRPIWTLTDLCYCTLNLQRQFMY